MVCPLIPACRLVVSSLTRSFLKIAATRSESWYLFGPQMQLYCVEGELGLYKRVVLRSDTFEGVHAMQVFHA